MQGVYFIVYYDGRKSNRMLSVRQPTFLMQKTNMLLKFVKHVIKLKLNITHVQADCYYWDMDSFIFRHMNTHTYVEKCIQNSM